MKRLVPLVLAVGALGACSSGSSSAPAPAASPSPSPATATFSFPPVTQVTASGRVKVGPGADESSLRQIVRDASNRVWIVSVDDEGHHPENDPGATVHLYRADQTGIPTSFSEADAAHAPTVPKGQDMSGGDTRLGRDNVLRTSYYRTDSDVCLYQTADLATGTWGATEVAAPGGIKTSAPGFYGTRGIQLCGLTLLADDTPMMIVAGDSGVLARRRTPIGWVDDALVSPDPSVHPSVVTDRQGRVQVSWLQGQHRIMWAERGTDGLWTKPVIVAEGVPLVQSNANLDQSPSLAVDASDEPVVLWQQGHPGKGDSLTTTARRKADGTWEILGPNVYSHTSGIHARGDDLFIVLGHDDHIHPGWLSLLKGQTTWDGPHPFLPTGSYDGSASTRFDPLRDPAPDIVDVVYFDENSDTRGGFRPDLFYASLHLPPAS